MSASWPGNMKGLQQVKIPLLLLMLWLNALTSTVFCQENEDEPTDSETVIQEEEEGEETVADTTTTYVSLETSPSPPEDPGLDSGEGNEQQGSGDDEKGIHSIDGDQDEDTGLNLIIIILIPVVLVVLIISIIVCGVVLNRRNQRARNQSSDKDDPYLDGPNTEKVPMPMFEEDLPSVLELEMDELEQWIKRDSGPAES